MGEKREVKSYSFILNDAFVLNEVKTEEETMYLLVLAPRQHVQLSLISICNKSVSLILRNIVKGTIGPLCLWKCLPFSWTLESLSYHETNEGDIGLYLNISGENWT